MIGSVRSDHVSLKSRSRPNLLESGIGSSIPVGSRRTRFGRSDLLTPANKEGGNSPFSNLHFFSTNVSDLGAEHVPACRHTCDLWVSLPHHVLRRERNPLPPALFPQSRINVSRDYLTWPIIYLMECDRLEA